MKKLLAIALLGISSLVSMNAFGACGVCPRACPTACPAPAPKCVRLVEQCVPAQKKCDCYFVCPPGTEARDAGAVVANNGF